MSTHLKRWISSVWFVVVIAVLVLVPRGYLISHAQSERYDDEYHIDRGVAFWRLGISNRPMNDPPLGEALTAIPMLLTHSIAPHADGSTSLYGHKLPIETLLNLIAMWKSLLFVPLVAVAFLWARELYGLLAGWAAAIVFLIEPTFVAHTPLPSVDVIGVEGIVIACYALWKYHQRPTTSRLLLGCLAVAAAMLLKNTAILIPGVAVAMAILWWVLRPLIKRQPWSEWKKLLGQRALHTAIGVVFTGFCIWALTLFNVSEPLRKRDMDRYDSATLNSILTSKLPAGTYIRAVSQGVYHATAGHGNFLDGERGRKGQIKYFPIVATYKLPAGLWALLGIGVASFVWRRPRFDEWSIALPGLVYLITLLNTDVNIGFRHFLPALAFMLLLAVRAAADAGKAFNLRGGLTLACLAIGFVETLPFHPNYLAFHNAVRGDPWLKITDSNLDWGQSLPAVKQWAAKQDKKRPISLAYFGPPMTKATDYYLKGSRVKVVLHPPYNNPATEKLPTKGLFIVSPVALTNVYDKSARMRPLWDVKPVDVIDHCLLVYDLDRLSKPIVWPEQRRDKPGGSTTAPVHRRRTDADRARYRDSAATRAAAATQATTQPAK